MRMTLETETLRPHVFDLDAFLAGAELAAAPREAIGLGARRLALDLGATAVPTGVALLSAGTGTVSCHPANEFVLVVRGWLVLRSAESTLELGPGDAAVIPQGAAYGWSAASDVTVVSQTYACPPAEGAAPVAVDRHAELTPSGAPLASLLTTPTPSCRNHLDHLSADGEWMVGTWDSTPYGRRPMMYGHDELMHILDGAVTITDETGRAQTFRAGSTFMVPRGAVCAWDNVEPVAKIYVIRRPKA